MYIGASQFIKDLLRLNPKNRVSAVDAMENDWIKNVSKKMVQDIKPNPDSKKSHSLSIAQVAKECLLALEKFDIGPEEGDVYQNKVDAHALISNTLLDDTHKQTLHKIFRIMDTSGDGQIGADELYDGYNEIIGDNHLSEEKAHQIVMWIDQHQNGQPKGFIDYSDFKIGCVDVTRQKFLKYCEVAYEKFFDNGQESIDTNELTGILCQEKLLKEKSIKGIVGRMDDNNNGSIQYFEFFDALIQAIGPNGFRTSYDNPELVPLTTKHIVEYLKEQLGNDKIGLTKKD